MAVNIQKLGMKGAIFEEIKRSGTKLKVYGLSEDLNSLLKGKPVVLAVNHQEEIELLALSASLPERKDAFLVATALILEQAPFLKKSIIPVYVRHRHSYFRSLSGMMLEKFYGLNISDEEKHQRNIASIKDAADKVRRGGSVAIVPNPHIRKWYSGIGWLIKNVGPMNGGYYIKVYVANTSPLDYLRLLPKIGKFLPTIEVYFDKPQKISDVFKEDAKTLTKKLEKEYNSWVKNLKS